MLDYVLFYVLFAVFILILNIRRIEAPQLPARHPDFQIVLQFLNLLPIVLFPPDIPFLPPLDVFFKLGVVVVNFLRLFYNLREAFIPITRLCIFGRIWVI